VGAVGEPKTSEYNIQAENKEASGWLLNYNDRIIKYKEALSEFSELSATVYTGMPHGSGVGFPTMNKAITLAEIERQKQWLMSVEETAMCLSEKKRAFLDFRRQAYLMPREVGRPGWVVYVQCKYADWHGRRYGREYMPTEKTVRDWWRQIVDIAARIAIRKRLI
jgi:hypothetical protein